MWTVTSRLPFAIVSPLSGTVTVAVPPVPWTVAAPETVPTVKGAPEAASAATVMSRGAVPELVIVTVASLVPPTCRSVGGVTVSVSGWGAV